MTKRMAVTVAMVAGFSAACGGGSDSPSSTSLQQGDVDLIANSLATALAGANASGGVAAVGSTPTTALVVPSPDSRYVATQAAVNYVAACPVAGHVTTTGNVFASCPTPPATGACTMSGALTVSYGDRTNNINDCAFANDLVIDGSLFISISGTAIGSALTLTESLTGSLGLYRKGPSGGLIPLEIGALNSCFILLTAKLPERTITGSVCGTAVNRTF